MFEFFKNIRKSKDKNTHRLILTEEDFRKLSSGNIVVKRPKNNKSIVVKFCLDGDVSKEKMSSIICEQHYKKRWRM